MAFSKLTNQHFILISQHDLVDFKRFGNCLLDKFSYQILRLTLQNNSPNKICPIRTSLRDGTSRDKYTQSTVITYNVTLH